MRKKAAGILKAVWTIVISVALISAGLMCPVSYTHLTLPTIYSV